MKTIFLSVLVGLLSASVSTGNERARLIFTGDIMAHIEQLEAAKRGASYDFAPQFRRVAPLLENALVVGNLETVFAGEKSRYTGYPAFNTPDDLAGALVDAGFHVVTLANNHILDRREKGAARTIDVLEDAGLLRTGLARDGAEAGDPLIVVYEGFKLAFLSFTYGSNIPPSQNVASRDVFLNVISDEAVEEGLARAGAQAPDLTIVCFHWGNEYQFAPTKGCRAIADLCFKNGADMVIGTHPHVLQPLEIVSADGGDDSPRLVAWSLGNFVSNQRTIPRERSVLLAVDVEKIPVENASGDTRIVRVAIAPTWVSSRRLEGRRLFEVVYAGTGDRFNHAGLPEGELRQAREAGKKVLEFLGATGTPDAEGFYTLWDAGAPDVLPSPGRRSPQ
jgi:poly-gamma-glutamate synthesis protein (capsule biosynthesis protein)